MNRRRIENRMAKVHREWIESIKDEKVKELAAKNSIITGGAITSLLMNQEPKDYDIYFTNFETTLAVTKYYAAIANVVFGRHDIKVISGKDYLDERKKLMNAFDIDESEWPAFVEETTEDIPWYMKQKFHNLEPARIRTFIRSSGVVREELPPEPDEEDKTEDFPEPTKKGKKKEEKAPYRPVFVSSNAITLSDKIQIINRFYGPADEIHETFDFVHTHNYWTSEDKKLVLNPDALEAILDKRLVYRGSRYPLCSILRMRKFLKRGWTINAGQILKIMFQISELDLTDIQVLEDQLIGVDTAYFRWMIERIQKELETVKDLAIDNGYVCTLVDEIFG